MVKPAARKRAPARRKHASVARRHASAARGHGLAAHRHPPRRRTAARRANASRRSRTPSSVGLVSWPLIAGAGCTLILGRTIAAHPGWASAILIIGAIAGAVLLWYRRLERRRWLDANARLERVDAMTGAEFEALVAALMRHDGYHDVRVVGRHGDRGVDVVARAPDGADIAVQCKRWSRPIGAAAVRDFVGALHCSYDGRQGLFVASASFTEQALLEASDAGITLIDRDGLGDWLTRTQRT